MLAVGGYDASTDEPNVEHIKKETLRTHRYDRQEMSRKQCNRSKKRLQILVLWTAAE